MASEGAISRRWNLCCSNGAKHRLPPNSEPSVALFANLRPSQLLRAIKQGWPHSLGILFADSGQFQTLLHIIFNPSRMKGFSLFGGFADDMSIVPRNLADDRSVRAWRLISVRNAGGVCWIAESCRDHRFVELPMAPSLHRLQSNRAVTPKSMLMIGELSFGFSAGWLISLRFPPSPIQEARVLVQRTV